MLAHRLREAGRLAIAATDRRLGEGTTAGHDQLGPHARPGAVVRNLGLLRAELRWQAPMFRHGLRLAVGAVLAEMIGRRIGTWYGLGLQEHAFWITLTTILVLFPEFRHTFSRGVGRSLGTLVGALLGWGLLQLPQGRTSLVVITVVLAAVALTTLRMGQPMLMVWVTSWVLYLLVQAGLVPAASAWTRAADTVTGAVLAMLLYAVWPTWYTWQLPQELAGWLELQGQRFAAILTAASGDPDIDYGALDALRHRSREARETFETAMRNAEEEPVWHHSPWTSEHLTRLHGAVRDLARQAPMLADTFLPPTDAVPAAASIGELLRQTMNGLARTALGGPPLAPGGLRTAWQPYAEQLRDSTSWADRHVLPTLQSTMDAVEELVSVMSTCDWVDRRRRGAHTASRRS